jgi:pimeloyl-ACP methyl ester carboxylesterase
MVRTIVVIAIFAAAGLAAEVQPPTLAGDWIGGLNRGQGWTLIRAHFKAQPGGMQGSLDLPERAGIPLTVLAAEPAAVRFRLALDSISLGFAGKLENDEISGTIEQNAEQGRFQLLRTAALAGAAAQEYRGAYQWDPDHFLYLQTWDELGPGQLGAFDESGEMRTLFPAGHDQFFTGPGLAFPVPREAGVIFRRDERGAISELVWRRDGAPDRLAKRARPYAEEEVAFRHGEVKLAGTLMTPAAHGPHPAVVVVNGSGPQDRYGSLPFVNFLVRHGIALLIYDKRGVGGSTGDWRRSSFDDLAGDALAAVQYLHARPEIDARQIGIFGASQGGWIAPLAAARSPEVAFIVSVSGPGVSPGEETLDFMQNELRAAGIPEPEIAEATALTKLSYAYARTGKGWERYRAARRKSEQRAWLPYVGLPAARDDWQWELRRLVFDYDPIPALAKVRCPTLAYFGELDLNVVPEKNRARWESALKAGGNQDYTLLIVPHGNHILAAAKTGTFDEFPTLSRFVPDYPQTLLKWLSQHLHGITP